MQRQLRLGDILDDYCPRERRVTNHAVVAMVGPDVKQTRCSTCDTEHEYKHAKVPRQRRKSETPAALYSQVLAGGPKRPLVHEPATPSDDGNEENIGERMPAEDATGTPAEDMDATSGDNLASANGNDPHAGDALEVEAAAEGDEDDEGRAEEDEGPVHRPLIRASLPRQEGQAPPPRTLPEFTIRQPGRANRFRPRNSGGGFGGGQTFQGNRSNGNTGGGQSRGGGGVPRHGAGGTRPPMMKRHGSGGRKRSK